MSVAPSADELRSARQDLDAVIREIRRVPGYQTFLDPPTPAILSGLRQPAVFVAATERAGLALVVDGDAVVDVELPALSLSAVRERVSEHQLAYAAHRADPHDPTAWRTALERTCSWLWDDAVEPWIDRLGGAAGVSLVPTGLLGLLPMHAAATADATKPTGRRYLLDEFPVSYLATLRVAHRQATIGDGPPRVLVVADPAPPPADLDPLPFAHHEADIVAAHLPGASVLRASAATVDAVRTSMVDADVVHLACHGLSDPGMPLRHALVLAGGRRLRMGDLLTMGLRGRLAVLSACETASIATTLPDEVLSLPTALIQAGIEGVVASQWLVRDVDAALMMADFYQAWQIQSLAPPAALRFAQRRQRDTTNRQKIETVEQELASMPGAGEAVEALIDELSLREPDAVEGCHLDRWAAYTYTGA